MSARTETRDGILLITLDNPPLNGLGLATREAILAGLQAAWADPGVVAIVLRGAGRAFCSGADIKEFGSARAYQSPNLIELIAAVEQSPKPVVAALHGVAMGGGLELAMGCHGRVASCECRLAMPEVKLGLIPGAGGTQRLPRAVGVAQALEWMASGQTFGAAAVWALAGQSLLDALVDGSDVPLGEAMALARRLAAQRRAGQPLPRLGQRPCGDAESAPVIEAMRARLAPRAHQTPAPMAVVEMVEAATRLPIAEGLALERQRFLALMDTPACQALRHLFVAERAAAKVPGLAADTPVRRVDHVAVVGAGTMGSGIATCCLDAGLQVCLSDADADALARGVQRIREGYAAQCAKGRLGDQAMADRLSRLTASVDWAPMAAADLWIEAVFEDVDVKRAVLQRIDAFARAGAIIASNTSTLDLDSLARATNRASEVVGLHFFSPAPLMRLLEVVRGGQTAPDVLASALSLARRLGKTAVVAGVCDGFIGNRLIEQYLRQALFMLDEGCLPWEVDAAIERFGMAMGPFRMSDLAGNDIGWHIRQRRYREQPALRYSRSADRLCEMGRMGQKTRAGWYDYPEGSRQAMPSAAVEDMLARHRAELGLPARRIGDDEIVGRLLLALVNEGARVLQEGIAQRASDIDVVYTSGYGFPAWRGGPMHHADTTGLPVVLAAMRRYAALPHGDAAFWQPAALLEACAREGRRLSDARPDPSR